MPRAVRRDDFGREDQIARPEFRRQGAGAAKADEAIGAGRRRRDERLGALPIAGPDHGRETGAAGNPRLGGETGDADERPGRSGRWLGSSLAGQQRYGAYGKDITSLANPFPVIDELAFQRGRKLITFNYDRRLAKRQREGETAVLMSYRRAFSSSCEVVGRWFATTVVH